MTDICSIYKNRFVHKSTFFGLAETHGINNV